MGVGGAVGNDDAATVGLGPPGVAGARVSGTAVVVMQALRTNAGRVVRTRRRFPIGSLLTKPLQRRLQPAALPCTGVDCRLRPGPVNGLTGKDFPAGETGRAEF